MRRSKRRRHVKLVVSFHRNQLTGECVGEIQRERKSVQKHRKSADQSRWKYAYQRIFAPCARDNIGVSQDARGARAVPSGRRPIRRAAPVVLSVHGRTPPQGLRTGARARPQPGQPRVPRRGRAHRRLVAAIRPQSHRRQVPQRRLLCSQAVHRHPARLRQPAVACPALP